MTLRFSFLIVALIASLSCSDDMEFVPSTELTSVILDEAEPYDFCITEQTNVPGNIVDVTTSQTFNGTLEEINNDVLCRRYIPNNGFSGQEEIRFIVTDDDNNMDTSFVRIIVDPTLILIQNEGGFGNNNANISRYFDADNSLVPEITGILGDILQDVLVLDDAGEQGPIIASVNNSNLVNFYDDISYAELASLEINQPRFIVQDDLGEHVYVSTLDGKIHEINVDRLEVTRSGSYGFNLDEIVLLNDRLYGVQRFSDKIHEIDLETLEIANSYTTLFDPASICTHDGELWLICSGDVFGSSGNLGGIQKLMPSSGVVSTIFSFSDLNIGFSPRIRSDVANDRLLFLKDALFSISDAGGTAVDFGGETYTQPYGLDINLKNGDIYVGDALDFAQFGLVRRFSSDGFLLNEFNSVGIGPNGFEFLQ